MLEGTGTLVLIVSNQANVGRGMLALKELEAINETLLATVAHHGGWIDAIYVCPHVPTAACDCRKPAPGLLLEAASDYGFDLSSAYMVGDHARDVEAALRAGCKAVFVGEGDLPEPLAARVDLRAVDLYDAVQLILVAEEEEA
jgi:histidinol-phosphate phosphatase family protein